MVKFYNQTPCEKGINKTMFNIKASYPTLINNLK